MLPAVGPWSGTWYRPRTRTWTGITVDTVVVYTDIMDKMKPFATVF